MNVGTADDVTVAPFNYAEALDEPGTADISQRLDIQLQQRQVVIAKQDKKSMISGYYPILSAAMSNGFAGYNSEFSPTRQLNNDWIRSSSFSLSLRVPLFDGFERHAKIQQKEMSIQRNINTLSMMQANAEREVQDAALNYQTYKRQLLSTKTSLDLAEQLFNSSQSEFENGITSTTELLNAQNDLSSARTNYSTALLNIKLAELSWKKANGTLIMDYQ